VHDGGSRGGGPVADAPAMVVATRSRRRSAMERGQSLAEAASTGTERTWWEARAARDNGERRNGVSVGMKLGRFG
jgi:hypothetical protein